MIDAARRAAPIGSGTRRRSPLKIDVRGLDFFYGKARALSGVELAVPANAVTAIIGPSGCGKSTLLRTINRIYELYPDQRAAGEIVIDGRNVLDRALSAVRRCARGVGMVFQKPTPFATTHPQECRFCTVLLRAASEAELDERIEDALRQAALWDEVKDKLDAQRAFAFGRAAAAAVHRANDRRPARDHPARRADLGARPDLDGARSRS